MSKWSTEMLILGWVTLRNTEKQLASESFVHNSRVDPDIGMGTIDRSSFPRREKFNSKLGVSFCRKLRSQAIYQSKDQG